ncbi:PIG-L deacetylase family protein [Kytococcus sedentarius]|uniref:PIG-L deacetylase family protein n=1 Tax=Kytococcus sedentarius TaxID=1276 RepID=UPI0035BBFDED
MSELPLFDSTGLERVLCVVAHPDDMEYGASAAVSAWTTAGVEVTYLLLTHGEAGMPDHPDEVRRIRPAEQQRACEQVGVEDLRVLDHPDGVLELTLGLRRDIARVIRQVRPQAVVTMGWADIAPWGVNQADHRVAGLSTADAVSAAGNRWIFPELVDDEGLEPWSTTWLLVTGTADPDQVIEVGAHDVAAAVASLEQHEAYLAALPNHPVPAEFIPQILAGGGGRAGVEAGLPVRAFKVG